MFVKFPTYKEVPMKEFEEVIEQVGQACAVIKKQYPSVWSAMQSQYRLGWSDKPLPETLWLAQLHALSDKDDFNRTN